VTFASHRWSLLLHHYNFFIYGISLLLRSIKQEKKKKSINNMKFLKLHSSANHQPTLKKPLQTTLWRQNMPWRIIKQSEVQSAPQWRHYARCLGLNSTVIFSRHLTLPFIPGSDKYFLANVGYKFILLLQTNSNMITYDFISSSIWTIIKISEQSLTNYGMNFHSTVADNWMRWVLSYP
jgi:hypothetical protein